MKESQALLRLQEIDLQLLRLKRQLSAMPQQKKLQAIAQAKRKLQGELASIVGQRKDSEMDVEDSEAAHDKFVVLMDEVKAQAAERQADYRQLTDLEAQLTSLAKRLEKIEFTHGEKVELRDRLRKAERNARGVMARLDEEAASQQEAFERASADLMAEVRKLAAERKSVVADLSGEVLARYEAASRRFGGLAVERLAGNLPSVCRVKLQPSQFSDLRCAGAEVTECPYCHRMLVFEGAFDEVE
ncbi:zinc ribbon domain-containing protein [Olsenella sp. DNF00959]|uniref:zinc ribbon domain-containing protein n=1 Tax=Olsenella sp. DNF00959 TaxID=1476999 RepID=UPI000785491F|nr:C4-type zinc ribbon domain-containing protein [Olsenella sp. DNF00959]KXB63464.1 zinc ribbon domain protein [Olsenella sp. DNF00959]